jgi:hypothetical protein
MHPHLAIGLQAKPVTRNLKMGQGRVGSDRFDGEEGPPVSTEAQNGPWQRSPCAC